MTSITPRLNRSREGRDGSYPLVIQIIRHRKKREIYTPYRFWEAEFNTRLEMVENTGGNRRRLLTVREANEYLIYIRKELTAICESLEAEKGSAYTVDDIVRVYNYHNDLTQVLVYADSVIAGLENKGRQGTAANYRSARRAFELFVGDRPFSFEELTPEVIDRFADFLRNRGNQPNTISFYLRQWRAIYNRACADHLVYTDQKPFRRLNLKEEVTAKRAISREKIARIEQVDLTASRADMQLARDLFLFSFYTRGMSFVDMCYINKENLQGDYLCYKRQKTGHELRIRVHRIICSRCSAVVTAIRITADSNASLINRSANWVTGFGWRCRLRFMWPATPGRPLLMRTIYLSRSSVTAWDTHRRRLHASIWIV